MFPCAPQCSDIDAPAAPAATPHSALQIDAKHIIGTKNFLDSGASMSKVIPMLKRILAT